MTSDRTKTPVKTLLAGCGSGIFQISTTYPIKFIKTQMQLEEKFGKERKYKGMYDCAKQTIKEFGFVGLYRGINVFFYGARAAVSFGMFEALKSRYADSNGVLSPSNRFICGLYSGAFEAALINTPLEAVECKLIHDRRLGKGKYNGFMHGAKVIMKEEGIRGFYTGLSASVLKQAGNQGTRFFVVETSKNLYQKGDPSVPVPKLMVGLFGTVAGFISVLITNPADVVKTRMQSLVSSRYKGIIDCFIKIWKEEGPYAFYRGLSPRISRVCIEVSLTFMAYDVFKDLLKVL